jgi:fermentation-respiration switch protein FrsA (DUF1100 family)
MLAWGIPEPWLASFSVAPLAAGAAGLLAGSVAAGALVGELSIHVPRHRRVQPDAGQADAIAAQARAEWEAVEILSADQVPLRAWLFTPTGAPSETVLVQHGFCGSRHGILSIAAVLLRNGYRVLTPDSRGHGASGDSHITFGMLESEDVRRWSRWLRRERDAAAVFGIGVSMGAATVLESIAQRPPFEAVIAECPYADFPDVVRHRLGWRWGLPRPLTPAIAPVAASAFAWTRFRYKVDLRRARPLEAIRQTHTPVLLIHGAQDRVIPIEHSLRLVEANPAADLWIVDGAAHAEACDIAPAEFERRVVGWCRAAGARQAAATAGT